MIDKRTGRLWYILAAAGSAGLPLPLYAAPAFAPPGSDGMMSAAQVDEAGKLAILLGQSQVVRPPFAASRVSVTDPNIADVQVLTPEQVLVMGKKPGSTDLVVWSADERVWRTRVEVGIDLDRLKSDLATAFPNASLSAAQLQNMVVVSGTLSRAEDATLLKEFLEKTGLPYVNRTSLAGIQQVQIRVRVAEVSRQALRTLGVNTYLSTGSVFGGIAVGSSTGPIQTATLSPGNVSASASPTVTMFGGFWHGDVQAFVQALAENQFLRVLAEPTLNCASGEEATFLAGGEFPVPIVQGSTGGANNNGTSISIEYKPFGVNLRFRPIVLGDNTIRLNVAPEVSDLSDVGAVIISGFRIPGIVTRRAETTLELKSGQTFALAGLLNQRTDALNSRIPGLGDIPILGALFRSVRYSQNDTELLIMVTADLVSPENIAGRTSLPGDLHNIPNDWELFATGKLEGANAPKLSAADAKWFHDQGIDSLIGPGAWAPYEAPAAKSAATARPDLSYSPPPKTPPPPPKPVEVRQLDMKPVEAPSFKPPPPPPPPPPSAPKPSSMSQPADPPAAHAPATAIAPMPTSDTTRSPAPITPHTSDSYRPAPATTAPVTDSAPKPAPAPKPTPVVVAPAPAVTAVPAPAAPKPAATTPMSGSAAASESFVPGNAPATAAPAPAPKPHAPETFTPSAAANVPSTPKPAAPAPAPAKPAPAPSSSETFVPGGTAAAAVPASAPASKLAQSETFTPAPHTAPDSAPKTAPSGPAATTPAAVNTAPKPAPAVASAPAPAPAPHSSTSETFRPGGAAAAAPVSTPAAPSTHSPETYTPTAKPAEAPKPAPASSAPAPARTTTPAPTPAPAPAPVAPAATRAPSSSAGETFRPGGAPASAPSPAPSATHAREPETFTPGAKSAVAPAPSAPAKPAAAPSPAPAPAAAKPAAPASKPSSGETFAPGGTASPSVPKPAAKPRDPETFVPGGPKATPPAAPALAAVKPAAASTPAPSPKPAPAVQLPPSSKPSGSDTFVPGGKTPASTTPATPKRSSTPSDETFKPGGM